MVKMTSVDCENWGCQVDMTQFDCRDCYKFDPHEMALEDMPKDIAAFFRKNGFYYEEDE